MLCGIPDQFDVSVEGIPRPRAGNLLPQKLDQGILAGVAPEMRRFLLRCQDRPAYTGCEN